MPLRNEEVELVWGLHATVFYLGVRKRGYSMPVPPATEQDIELRVAAFLHGAPFAFARIATKAHKPRRH